MTPDMASNTKPAPQREKPFPRRCARCRQLTVHPVAIPYRSEILHDGRLHMVEVPQLTVPRCQNCGELSFDNRAEDQIDEVFRAQLRLLTPEQIRTNRQTLGLTPRELETRLGVEDGLVAAWEAGLRIQSRVQDNMLRLYYSLPQVRSFLAQDTHLPDFGTCVVQ